MKPYILSLTLLLCFAACKQNDQPPIPPQKMEEILTDLHYAEVYSMMLDDTLHQARSRNMDSLAVYYKDVLAHHKVSEDAFMQSMDWYKNHAEDIDSVYSHVLLRVSAAEGNPPPQR